MRQLVGWACRNSFVKGFVLALMLLLVATPLLAQVSTGSGVILGTVKDSSGAVVVGATVTIRNVDTGVSRSQMTDDNGAYRFSSTTVGHYDVVAEHPGFKTTTQREIVLDVAQEVAINFTLEVGTSSQEVTVTGEAPLVTTTSTQLGGLVDEEAITDLPLNGRNYLDLTLLQAGVTSYAPSDINHIGGGSNGTIYSSNGAPIISNNFLLDGTVMQTVLGYNNASGSGASLGVDGIREYKVITSAFPAEYGLTMGSQMVIISKGGSNTWHGDAFDYLRNRVLDSRNFFITDAIAPSKPEYIRNNFGGAFGGPIKKDKTFFWAVFEGLREVKGIPEARTTFSNGCVENFNPSEPFLVWNGQGTPPPAPAGGTVSGPCVDIGTAGGLATGQHTNYVQLASTMAPILNLYPVANYDCNSGPESCTTSITPYVQPTNEYYGQFRLDQNFSNNDQFFSRYTMDTGTQRIAVNYQPLFQDDWYARNQYLTFSENHIISASLLNTARFAISRTNVPTTPETGAAAFGSNLSFAAPSSNEPIGIINFGGGANGSVYYNTFGPDLAAPNFHLQYIYSLADDVTYTKGKHAIKFGFLGDNVRMYIRETVLERGQMNFNDATDFFTGNPYIEVAKVPGFPGGAGGRDGADFRFFTYGFYLQDDWHVKPRLTFNLGLRYEFNTTPNVANGEQQSNINVTATTTTAVLTPESMIKNASLHDFSPRVGFAYDVTGDGKTAVRGFFGIYYDIATIGNLTFPFVVTDPLYRVIAANLGFNTYGQTQNPTGTPLGSLVFQPGWIAGNGGGVNPVYAPNPLAPNGGVTGCDVACVNYNQNPATGGTLITALNPGIDPTLPTYNDQQPYLMQWNLSVSRQLPGNMALNVAYVGTRGVHLWGQSEGNPCLPEAFVDGVPNWVNAANASCPLGRQMTNLGYWTLINTHQHSWYDGLQASLTKKLGHGLELQTAYTYSKSLDTTQGAIFVAGQIQTNDYDLNVDKGPSQFDATHNLRINALYHFHNISSDSFAAGFLKGWWMGNIITAQSGFAFSPELTNNQSGSGQVNDSDDRPWIAPNFNASTVITHNINQWFNPTMYEIQPAGYLGNAARDSLRGPRLVDWDFSLVKDTKLRALGEAGNLEFRAEFFNFLNHPNFSLPNPFVATGSAISSITPITAANEAPSSGAIDSTATDSRDIQFALKLIF